MRLLRACASACAASMLGACATPATKVETTAAQPLWTDISKQIRVNRSAVAVEFTATAVIETGFLEEYVCTVGTREHESLFAFDGKASEIHAAMLLAGFIAGTPGRWREIPNDDGSLTLELVLPTGDAVEASVRMPDGATHALDWFVRRSPIDDAGVQASTTQPPRQFRFAGSRFRTDRKSGREFYLADGSGSLVGLVTFGDEVIAPVEVIPDQASAAAPIWEVFSERMPKPGTPVTIVLSRAAPAHPATLRSETDKK